VSTCVSKRKPVSTCVSQRQPVSASVNPCQPVSARVDLRQPVSTCVSPCQHASEKREPTSTRIELRSTPLTPTHSPARLPLLSERDYASKSANAFGRLFVELSHTSSAQAPLCYQETTACCFISRVSHQLSRTRIPSALFRECTTVATLRRQCQQTQARVSTLPRAHTLFRECTTVATLCQHVSRTGPPHRSCMRLAYVILVTRPQPLIPEV
jgi:hypothetical protein